MSVATRANTSDDPDCARHEAAELLDVEGAGEPRRDSTVTVFVEDTRYREGAV